MESFTMNFGRHGFARLLGHNPLVRRSDRVEALALLMSTMIVVIALPVVAAVGTAVHDSRLTSYTEQAHSRHRVTATALHDSTTIARANQSVGDSRPPCCAADPQGRPGGK